MIGAALEAAADADAVKAARRFAFAHRESIYRAGALSRRALQLTETFPVLALAIYAEHWQVREYGERHAEPLSSHERFSIWDAEAAELRLRKNEAIKLVVAGARLRDVAGAMGIPMALRDIKPGVAHLATGVFCRHPEILNFMPDTTWQQRIWLLVVHWAYQRGDDDFSAWAARHIPGIQGRTHQEVGNFLADIADWVRSQEGREFITRPFVPSMSLRTATTLSAEWHEAVANRLDGRDRAFPAPWYPATKIGNTDIVPIENAASLYREGQAMHHCVGTYSDRVLAGHFCIYSIKRDGARVATLALGRYREGNNCKVYIEQISRRLQ